MANDPIIDVIQQNVPAFDGPEPAESVLMPDPMSIPLGLSRVVPGATAFSNALTRGQYEGMSRTALFDSALKQPLSLFSTLEQSARQGVMNSYGLGTVLRESQVPLPAPSQDAPYGFDPEGLDVPPGTSPQDYLQGTWVTPGMIDQKRDEMGALTEDQYKASAFYRNDVPYDPGMTETRAAALAGMSDLKKVREFYAQKRPFSAFIGNLAGQALDPINYVPVAGPLVKAAAIGRFGRVAGEALTAGLDAAANTAVFGIGTANARAKFGDDVSWEALTSQVATAALIGSAFGGLHGFFGRNIDPVARAGAEARFATLRTTQEARIALNEGIDALVRGEDIKLSPNVTQPIARVAADAANLSPATAPEAAFVTRAAGIQDVAISIQTIKDQHPELDPVTSPSKFDALLIADLQAKGFDGVESKAPAAPVPLKFDPSTVDVPEMVTGPNGRPIEAALNPTSPAFGERLIADAEARLPELQKRLAKANRPHNRLRARLDQNSFLSGVVDPLGTLERTRNLPDLVTYYEAQKARGEAILAGKVDPTQATPEPRTSGVQEAQGRLGKTENAAALADQYGVNPNTGAYGEEADIMHLARSGRLTEEDQATLDAAHQEFRTASAFGEAMKSLATCLI
ncbi:hypothetical protein [Mesorhizobium sp. B2-6-4]|uniref:hypothetical protein n=1 Tax=Mesorhizobium sp. B2-6-4 TaxID=2589913 RepID=UPI00112B8E31|nr:hypothetical protein [Mesorhizobium sp. B2-6-4]TPJ50633.1 hypothetical protein FJ426_24590 [Mesorhizobium sp. B2-6-4]